MIRHKYDLEGLLVKMNLTAKDLSLDETALELLREVERGERVFQPEDDTRESLDGFQEKVKLVRALETRGFIVEINGLNMASRDGKTVIDKVRLRGGLTEKGRALLAKADAGVGESVEKDDRAA